MSRKNPPILDFVWSVPYIAIKNLVDADDSMWDCREPVIVIFLDKALKRLGRVVDNQYQSTRLPIDGV